MAKPALHKCKCGGTPKFRCSQVAEDYEECWVICTKCGAETDAAEDSYCDYATAAWMWNTGLAAPPINEQCEEKP